MINQWLTLAQAAHSLKCDERIIQNLILYNRVIANKEGTRVQSASVENYSHEVFNHQGGRRWSIIPSKQECGTILENLFTERGALTCGAIRDYFVSTGLAWGDPTAISCAIPALMRHDPARFQFDAILRTWGRFSPSTDSRLYTLKLSEHSSNDHLLMERIYPLLCEHGPQRAKAITEWLASKGMTAKGLLYPQVCASLDSNRTYFERLPDGCWRSKPIVAKIHSRTPRRDAWTARKAEERKAESWKMGIRAGLHLHLHVCLADDWAFHAWKSHEWAEILREYEAIWPHDHVGEKLALYKSQHPHASEEKIAAKRAQLEEKYVVEIDQENLKKTLQEFFASYEMGRVTGGGGPEVGGWDLERWGGVLKDDEVLRLSWLRELRKRGVPPEEFDVEIEKMFTLMRDLTKKR